MVRLGAWGFAVIYVSAGALSERYDVDIGSFSILFAIYFLCFLAIIVSVVIRPEWDERRYVSLSIDVSATTVCVYLSGEGASPFFIFYIWIFISYGSRYGRQHLKVASMLSIFAYSGVITLMGHWGKYFFEVSFVLLSLAFLPIYQHLILRKLEKASSETKRSSRMVGRFLSNMTNEMRGPLVDILGTTKELSGQELKTRQLDLVNDINSSASVLDSVIGDVLDYYKLESKQLHLNNAPFDIHLLISNVCSSLAKTAWGKQKELVCSVSSGVPKIILGDEQRLKQVLTNVLRSAINCCLGEEIQVSVLMDNTDLDMLLFEIKGIAPPIPDEVITYDDVPLSENESPDLGNSFASKIISLVGGEFGSGPREDKVIYWFSIPAKINGFEVAASIKKPGLQGKRVFVFEPNKISRDEIVTCCVEQGMYVETVDKVSDLSDKISWMREREDVDLVIIADSVPGRDMSRIADICMDVLGGDLPLLALSHRRDCLDQGDYFSARIIGKPFLHEQLSNAMELVLTGHA
jgi:two-component system sensor histidine kinase RpfC